MEPEDLARQLLDLSVAARTLAEQCWSAVELQWEAGPVEQAREVDRVAASGLHGDPTASVVLDGRRLAVRDALHTAELALKRSCHVIRMAEVEVTKSVDSWYTA